MNEIDKYDGEVERAWNGKRVRCTIDQFSEAIQFMFAAFPGLKMEPTTFNAYYMMLRDLDADRLASSILKACQEHEYPTQLITIAAIRKAYGADARPPAASSETPQRQLSKPIPDKMFKLDPDEDRKQRMERLRQTRNWSY